MTAPSLTLATPVYSLEECIKIVKEHELEFTSIRHVRRTRVDEPVIYYLVDESKCPWVERAYFVPFLQQLWIEDREWGELWMDETIRVHPCNYHTVVAEKKAIRAR